MVNVISSDISIKTTVSKNSDCRFVLTKTWNTDKPNALFILMNPSKGTSLKLDNTIVNINNHCVENNYGSFTIVNLFPLMATNPKELSGNLKREEANNIKYIKECLNTAEDIFIAWGVENKYVLKKREIEKIISNKIAPNKVFCWQDDKGKYPKHLRIMSDKWKLTQYINKYQ